MAVYGQEMQELGFTEAWLMAAGKQLIWQRFLQSKIRKRAKALPAKALPAAPSDGEAGPPATSQVSSAGQIIQSVLPWLYNTMSPCMALLCCMCVTYFNVV